MKLIVLLFSCIPLASAIVLLCHLAKNKMLRGATIALVCLLLAMGAAFVGLVALLITWRKHDASDTIGAAVSLVILLILPLVLPSVSQRRVHSPKASIQIIRHYNFPTKILLVNVYSANVTLFLSTLINNPLWG